MMPGQQVYVHFVEDSACDRESSPPSVSCSSVGTNSLAGAHRSTTALQATSSPPTVCCPERDDDTKSLDNIDADDVHNDVAINLSSGETVSARAYSHAVSGHHVMLQQQGRIWKATRSHREERFYTTLKYSADPAGVRRRTSPAEARDLDSTFDEDDEWKPSPSMFLGGAIPSSDVRRSALAIAPFVPNFFGTKQVSKVRCANDKRTPATKEEAGCEFPSSPHLLETKDFDAAAIHNAEDIVASFARVGMTKAQAAVISKETVLTPPLTPTTANVALKSTMLLPARAPEQTQALDHHLPRTADHLVNMIVLEDLCYGFVHPCVLDLKMGTRQYGVNATAEKRSSKIAKAMRSTSSTLGLRISGYKKWDVVHQVEEAVGKGQTKEFKADDVQRTLFHFLNGDGALINAFLKLSRDFEAAFQQQTAFRFFTSSVLLLYDAERPLQTARLVMVDFAYTYCAAELIAEKDEDANLQRDEGYIQGIQSMEHFLEQCWKLASGCK